MTIYFVVNCQPLEFANWLKLYTEELYEASALTMHISRNEIIGYAPADIEIRDKDAGQLRMSIRATIFNFVGQDDDFRLVKRDGPPGDVFIGFTLTPLSRERTEVKANALDEALEFFAILIRLIAERYPEATAAIGRRTEETLPDWRASNHHMMNFIPGSDIVSLSFENVETACYEHLEHLCGKRFPADWDVKVTRYVEKEGDILRYDVQSARRMVGHIRIRRLDRQRTKVDVEPFLYGDDNDVERLQEILSLFGRRWLTDRQFGEAVGLLPDPIVNAPPNQLKGGRPRNPDNQWACEQVHDLGRKPGEVYPEWIKRIGERAAILDNPRDSFNKAIKQKKRK